MTQSNAESGTVHAYDSFALAYGKAGFHRFAVEIGKRLARDWKKRYGAGGWVADLGAGDGGAVKAFQKAGFRIVGIDLSLGMLQRNPGHAVQADMRQLPLRDGFSGAICLYDAVNHLRPEDLPLFFAEVARILQPGAPFAFDANTEAGSRMWDGDAFTVERSNMLIEVTSEYDARARHLTNRVKGWVSEKGGRRQIDDVVEEWFHPDAELVEEVKKAGFRIEEETGICMDENHPDTPSKFLYEFVRI